MPWPLLFSGALRNHLITIVDRITEERVSSLGCGHDSDRDWKSLSELSFRHIAFEVMVLYLSGIVPKQAWYADTNKGLKMEMLESAR